MSTKTKTKQATFGAAVPGSNKIPRAAEVPNEHLLPDFKTDKMDMGGQWGWVNFKPNSIQEFLNKLFESQKLTWQELRQNGSHPILVEKIVRGARKRLQTIQLDDTEELYSIHLSGKSRLWGLKEGRIFWILWWDPEHEICPSLKKHT